MSVGVEIVDCCAVFFSRKAIEKIRRWSSLNKCLIELSIQTSVVLDAKFRHNRWLISINTGMTIKLLCASAVLCACIAAQSTQAAEAVDPHSIQRLDWQTELSGERTFVINNPWGHVHLRRAKDATFVYHAVVQVLGRDDIEARVQAEETAQNVQLSVLWPEAFTPSADAVRIDLSIVLPESAALDVELADGTLSSGKLAGGGLRSAIKARTKSGDIELSTSGAVDLFSATGEITVKLLNGSKEASHSIKTHSSDVHVIYRGDVKFEVISGGYVTADDAELLRSEQRQQRTRVYKKGDAKHAVRVQTDVGDVLMVRDPQGNEN